MMIDTTYDMSQFKTIYKYSFLNNGQVNALVDAIYLLSWGFIFGPPIQPPFPDCGPDPDDSGIECMTSPCP